MKKKNILSIIFIFSLLPILLKQYGGAKGVQEISGNPTGIISFILFFMGIWLPLKNIYSKSKCAFNLQKKEEC